MAGKAIPRRPCHQLARRSGSNRPARPATYICDAPGQHDRTLGLQTRSSKTTAPTRRSTTRSRLPGATCLRPAAARRSRACAAEAGRQARLPLADARPLLRHGLAAAHPDPLLHRQGPGRGPQEHRRRHRQHRLLLRPDALPRPRRDDQRHARRDRHQHGRAAAGPELRRAAVRGDLGDRLHDGAGHRQRPDHGGQRRGGARPMANVLPDRDERPRQGPRGQDRRRSSSA